MIHNDRNMRFMAMGEIGAALMGPAAALNIFMATNDWHMLLRIVLSSASSILVTCIVLVFVHYDYIKTE